MKLNTLMTDLKTNRLILCLLAIKLIGVGFATLVFARFSPLVDSELYIKGFYNTEITFRTRAIQFMASFLNSIGGSLMAHLTFGLISVVGLIYYYITGGRRWVLMLTLLLPSTLVWTSIVGKEAIFTGGMGLALVVWSKYAVKPLNWLDMVAVMLALVVCALLRPHYAIAIVWLFIATVIIKRKLNFSEPILIILILIAATAIYFTVWNELLLRGFGAIEYTGRASRHQMLGILTVGSGGFDQAFENYKSWIPFAVITGIVGPLPSEAWQRLELLPFLFEGVFVLFSPLFVALWVKKHIIAIEHDFFRIFGWCLLPAILMLMVLHAPFGLLNPGSATRWRVNFEQIFYLAPLLLMYRFMDVDSTENHSLSP